VLGILPCWLDHAGISVPMVILSCVVEYMLFLLCFDFIILPFVVPLMRKLWLG
jgi:hypothetical protein